MYVYHSMRYNARRIGLMKVYSYINEQWKPFGHSFPSSEKDFSFLCLTFNGPKRKKEKKRRSKSLSRVTTFFVDLDLNPVRPKTDT